MWIPSKVGVLATPLWPFRQRICGDEEEGLFDRAQGKLASMQTHADEQSHTVHKLVPRQGGQFEFRFVSTIEQEGNHMHGGGGGGGAN